MEIHYQPWTVRNKTEAEAEMVDNLKTFLVKKMRTIFFKYWILVWDFEMKTIDKGITRGWIAAVNFAAGCRCESIINSCRLGGILSISGQKHVLALNAGGRPCFVLYYPLRSTSSNIKLNLDVHFPLLDWIQQSTSRRSYLLFSNAQFVAYHIRRMKTHIYRVN